MRVAQRIGLVGKDPLEELPVEESSRARGRHLERRSGQRAEALGSGSRPKVFAVHDPLQDLAAVMAVDVIGEPVQGLRRAQVAKRVVDLRFEHRVVALGKGDLLLGQVHAVEGGADGARLVGIEEAVQELR
jgi:hypothetical protein